MHAAYSEIRHWLLGVGIILTLHTPQCTAVDPLYAEACFPLQVSYSCDGANMDRATCPGRYLYQATSAAATATLTCPQGTQITITGFVDYVFEDIPDTVCYEYSKNCTVSALCDCCMSPQNKTGLCLRRYQNIVQSYIDQCNSGVTTCQVNNSYDDLFIMIIFEEL